MAQSLKTGKRREVLYSSPGTGLSTKEGNTANGLGMAKQHGWLPGVYPLHLEANITKGMTRLYTENYKTVLRKVKEDL